MTHVLHISKQAQRGHPSLPSPLPFMPASGTRHSESLGQHWPPRPYQQPGTGTKTAQGGLSQNVGPTALLSVPSAGTPRARGLLWKPGLLFPTPTPQPASSPPGDSARSWGSALPSKRWSLPRAQAPSQGLARKSAGDPVRIPGYKRTTWVSGAEATARPRLSWTVPVALRMSAPWRPAVPAAQPRVPQSTALKSLMPHRPREPTS